MHRKVCVCSLLLQDVERHFSRDELRDLFTLNGDTKSDTHDR